MNQRDLAGLFSYLEEQPEPRIVIDGNYTIIGANRAYRAEYGAVDGKRCFEVSHRFSRPCDEVGESCPLKASVKSGHQQRVLHVHHTPRGEEHVDVELTPFVTSEGKYYVEKMQFVRTAGERPANRGLIGRSPAFNKMLSLVQRAAPSEAAVLLLGESGTGKEMAAQLLHDGSPRASKPFVPVDCSGLSETLFESELFGYEKGAFTGANQRKPGLVEAAAGGTLFLDEAGDIPLALQVKLLRLLETGTYRRVGGIEPLRADFRLVAATHRDLKKMVADGTFRQDLYFRISTFPIHLPALKERMDDLPRLCQALLSRLYPEREYSLSMEAMEILSLHDFPGNVRELRNLLERACLLADSTVLLPEHFPELQYRPEPGSGPVFSEVLTLDEVERRYLMWVMRRPEETRRDLALQLGVSERTLFRKIGKLRV